jgi:hypothetical protein
MILPASEAKFIRRGGPLAQVVIVAASLCRGVSLRLRKLVIGKSVRGSRCPPFVGSSGKN